ncbi:MAG: PD-(D/E)XK nuclease family protein [Candidatus Limnocylindrales bacterium]
MPARERFLAELDGIGRAAAMDADEARAAGLDPLTLRTIAADTGAGANLLQVAPLPSTFSYTSFSSYDACGLQYAFRYVYRVPGPDKPVAAYTFGSTAHEAFEAFTKERRERAARGEPPPSREDLEAAFRARWVPTGFGDRTTEEGYQRRVASLLDNFWEGEIASLGEALREEQDFELRLGPGRRRRPGRSSTAPSTGSTGCPTAASRSSTTRPAAPRARRSSTRACSSRSTRSPAAMPWASGRRRGSRCTSPRRRCGCRRPGRTSSWTRPATRSWPASRPCGGDFPARRASVPLLRLPGDVPGAVLMGARPSYARRSRFVARRAQMIRAAPSATRRGVAVQRSPYGFEFAVVVPREHLDARAGRHQADALRRRRSHRTRVCAATDQPRSWR